MATIVAIITGPIVALWLQRISERRGGQRDRKRVIFKELMATRASTVSHRHVDALNSIEVEFSGGSRTDKRVLEAWRLYLDHLSNANLEESDLKRWRDKGNDLLIDMLYEMSRALRYDFNKVALKKNIYSPKAHGDREAEEYLLRKFAVEVMAGKRAILAGIATGKNPLDVRVSGEIQQTRSSPYIPDPSDLFNPNAD